MTGINLLDPLRTVERASHDFIADIRPDLTGNAYFNYLRWNEPDRVRTAFTKEKFYRLQTIKRRYDTRNVFHANLNIKPLSPVRA